MGAKIVAIRVDLKGEKATLTTLGASPRGTRVRLKSEEVDGTQLSKKALEEKLTAAIERLTGRPGAVPE